MLRASIVLATLALTCFAAEARAQSGFSRQPGRLRPIGNPTAWVTAKSPAHITMAGGSGSRVSSCVNRGSAAGTFDGVDTNNQPRWYDDGFLGAGNPYFWFGGHDAHENLSGSLPSSAYVTSSACTIYIVMYAHVLQENNTASISQNPTAIEFHDVGLAVRAGDGGRAIGLHRPLGPPQYDFIEAPITSGDATLHVWKLAHVGGVLSLSVDGGAPVTVATGTTNALTSAPIVGFDGQSFNPGAYYGAIGEWIVYNRAVTPVEDAFNMQYLRDAWGTP